MGQLSMVWPSLPLFCRAGASPAAERFWKSMPGIMLLLTFFRKAAIQNLFEYLEHLSTFHARVLQKQALFERYSADCRFFDSSQKHIFGS